MILHRHVLSRLLGLCSANKRARSCTLALSVRAGCQASRLLTEETKKMKQDEEKENEFEGKGGQRRDGGKERSGDAIRMEGNRKRKKQTNTFLSALFLPRFPACSELRRFGGKHIRGMAASDCFPLHCSRIFWKSKRGQLYKNKCDQRVGAGKSRLLRWR